MASAWLAIRRRRQRAYAPAIVVLLVALAVLTNSVASTYSGFIHTHSIVAVMDHGHDQDSHGHSHDNDNDKGSRESRPGCVPLSFEFGSACNAPIGELTHEHAAQIVIALPDAGSAPWWQHRSAWNSIASARLKPWEHADLERPPRSG